MRRHHLRPVLRRNQPVARQGNTAYHLRIFLLSLFPFLKIDCSRKRRHHNELCERDVRLFRQSHSGIERIRLVRGQSENERTQNVNSMFPEGLQLLHQTVAGIVKVLEHSFQTFSRNGFHSHQRTFDPCLLHGVQKFQILSRFHRNLGEENHVSRQFGKPRHQHEPFIPNRLQRGHPLHIALLFSQSDIGFRHRIEIVIRECNKAKTLAPQRHNLFNDRVGSALTRLLAIRPPYRTERTMLGAPAYCLHRCPHVTAFRHQIPPRRQKLLRLNPSAVVNFAQRTAHAILQSLSPDHIAITLDHRMGSAQFQRLFRVERRVDPAVDYRGPQRPG